MFVTPYLHLLLTTPRYPIAGPMSYNRNENKYYTFGVVEPQNNLLSGNWMWLHESGHNYDGMNQFYFNNNSDVHTNVWNCAFYDEAGLPDDAGLSPV